MSKKAKAKRKFKMKTYIHTENANYYQYGADVITINATTKRRALVLLNIELDCLGFAEPATIDELKEVKTELLISGYVGHKP